MSLIHRQAYIPTPADWAGAYNMLCMHCAHQIGCDVTEGMIDCKDGSSWPEGGWVTDPGSGVTCLSYRARQMRTLSPDELHSAFSKARPEMCNGCAAQRGSEASVSLHTQRDFAQAVNCSALFLCHEDSKLEQPCAGWRNAVRRKQEAM
jgi:hypothetical protein